MDDVVTATDNLEDARKLEREIVEIASKGGCYFKEFVLSEVGDQKELDLIGSNKAGRVLGIAWESFRDVISFHVNINPFKKKQG